MSVVFLQDPSSLRAALLALQAGMCLIYLSLTCFQPIFKRLYLVISLLLWTTLLVLYFTSYSLKDVRTAMEGVAYIYYIIFIIYTMLPLPVPACITLGSLTALLHLLFSGFMINNTTSFLTLQVISSLSF